MRSTDRNQAFGALGCADSFQRIYNLFRLISLRCFCRRQLNCESRRCNLPASSQIVLVLFCIQMFDRHSDWFVDRTRNFDSSDLKKSRMSYCCSVSFLHPILRWRRFTPFLLFLNRHSYLCTVTSPSSAKKRNLAWYLRASQTFQTFQAESPSSGRVFGNQVAAGRGVSHGAQLVAAFFTGLSWSRRFSRAVAGSRGVSHGVESVFIDASSVAFVTWKDGVASTPQAGQSIWPRPCPPYVDYY